MKTDFRFSIKSIMESVDPKEKIKMNEQFVVDNFEEVIFVACKFKLDYTDYSQFKEIKDFMSTFGKFLLAHRSMITIILRQNNIKESEGIEGLWKAKNVFFKSLKFN